jgi:hypothetical protein
MKSKGASANASISTGEIQTILNHLKHVKKNTKSVWKIAASAVDNTDGRIARLKIAVTKPADHVVKPVTVRQESGGSAPHRPPVLYL